MKLRKDISLFLATTMLLLPLVGEAFEKYVPSRPRSATATNMVARTLVKRVAPTTTQIVVPSQQPVQPVKPIDVVVVCQELATACKADVPKIFAQALQNATSIDVPKILAVALQNATKANIMKIVAVALENATEATRVEIATQIYASLTMLLTPEINAIELVELKNKWYDKFSAANGSRLWWILKLAKEKAVAGESVEDLKKLFDETMNKWLEEEDNEP